MICTRASPLLRPSHEAACESRWVVLFIVLNMCLSSAHLCANETNRSLWELHTVEGSGLDVLQRWKGWRGKVKCTRRFHIKSASELDAEPRLLISAGHLPRVLSPQCHMGGTGLLTWGRVRQHPFSRNGSLSLPWSLSLQGELGTALLLILEPWGWSDGVKWNPCRHLD